MNSQSTTTVADGGGILIRDYSQPAPEGDSFDGCVGFSNDFGDGCGTVEVYLDENPDARQAFFELAFGEKEYGINKFSLPEGGHICTYDCDPDEVAMILPAGDYIAVNAPYWWQAAMNVGAWFVRIIRVETEFDTQAPTTQPSESTISLLGYRIKGETLRQKLIRTGKIRPAGEWELNKKSITRSDLICEGFIANADRSHMEKVFLLRSYTHGEGVFHSIEKPEGKLRDSLIGILTEHIKESRARLAIPDNPFFRYPEDRERCEKSLAKDEEILDTLT